MVVLSPQGPALPEIPEEESLYYVVESAFTSSTLLELQASGGFDFSNPYLNLYSGTLAAFVLLDKSIAVGVEASKFTSGTRASVERLQSDLSYAFQTDFAKPDWGGSIVFRYTPISGMVNLFAARILQADISLVFKGGAIKYAMQRTLPTFGTGVNVHLGFSSSWGLLFQTIWDWDKPTGESWQSRVGIRLGPTLRF